MALIKIDCGDFRKNTLYVTFANKKVKKFVIERALDLNDYQILNIILSEMGINSIIEERYKNTRFICSLLFNNLASLSVKGDKEKAYVEYQTYETHKKEKIASFPAENFLQNLLELPFSCALIKQKHAPKLIERYKKEVKQFLEFKQRQIEQIKQDIETLYGLEK